MENTHLCLRGPWWWSNLAENFFPTQMTRRANLTSLQEEKIKGLGRQETSYPQQGRFGMSKDHPSQDQIQVPPIRQPQGAQLTADVVSRGIPRWVSSPFRGDRCGAARRTPGTDGVSK